MLFAPRQGLAQSQGCYFDIASPSGETDYQQSFASDVEAPLLLSKYGRALAKIDCIEPSVCQGSMGAENRKVGIGCFTDLLQPCQERCSFGL